MTINQVVQAYMKCGEQAGFFAAEMILLKHLPPNKPDGACKDVSPSRWPSFVSELEKAMLDAKARQWKSRIKKY